MFSVPKSTHKECIITKLQAINIILSSVGETELETLENPGADTVLAISALERATEEIQLSGWHFNRDENYALIPDNSGIIHIPLDVHRVVAHNSRRYVKKGSRLFDNMKNTFNIGKTVKATVLRIIPFEDMPLTFRYYAAIRGAKKFQNSTLSSSTIRSVQEKDEAEARFACLKEEQQVSRPTLKPLSMLKNSFFWR